MTPLCGAMIPGAFTLLEVSSVTTGASSNIASRVDGLQLLTKVANQLARHLFMEIGWRREIATELMLA